MKNGFTLSDVLITLGILGVIAAITLPSVINNYRKKALETGLLRFYSLMNQAFYMSSIENGPVNTWNYFDGNSCQFYKTYLAKYLNNTEYECGYYNGKNSKMNDDRFVGIYFPSGDMAVFSYARVFIYTNKKKYYKNYQAWGSNSSLDSQMKGTELFAFEIAKYRVSHSKDIGIIPFDGLSIYSNDQLLQRCKEGPSRCTAVIARNGWKIPDNYPFEIR